MKKNIILIAFAAILISSQAYASRIKTISSGYNIEGGAHLSDGEIRTQKTSGGLFYAMGESGDFNWVGYGSKKDQNNEMFKAYGFATYKATETGLSFDGNAEVSVHDSRFISGTAFVKSELDWNFRVEGGDTELVFTYYNIKDGQSSLYDETMQEFVFNSDDFSHVDNYFSLKSNHEYSYLNTFTTTAQDMTGYIDIRFDKARMEIPTPATFGLFGLAFLGLLVKKRKYNKNS